MFMVDLLQWWYFRGWGVFFSGLRTKLGDTADLFSIGDMFRTLFKPFRQISAGASGSEALDAKMAQFFDRLISRIVGMFARLTIILAGTVVLILELIFGTILMILWPVVPLLPVCGIVLMIMGVTF